MRGEPGPSGARGESGAQGRDGAPGPTGPQGAPGGAISKIPTGKDSESVSHEPLGFSVLPLYVLLLFMCVAAVIGGLATYSGIGKSFRNKKQGVEKDADTTVSSEESGPLLFVAESFLATALVPLFLTSISSDVLSKSAKDPGQMLVFFSYCLLAALGARPFIQLVISKAMPDSWQTRKIPPPGPAPTSTRHVGGPSRIYGGGGMMGDRERLGDQGEKVLAALNTPGVYSLRTIATQVPRDTNEGEESRDKRVRQALDELVQKGLALRMYVDQVENLVWVITDSGRLLPRHDPL